jgi:diguanylate cyclase (GGDEF)-like protein
MSAGVFSHDSQHFAPELDEAAQSHMAWTRRLLRCAVLRSAPDDDIAAADAHLRCPFALWFRRHRQRFDELDADAARRLDERHRQMHDAARRICRRIAAGRPGDVGELDAFERAQAGVVADLALLKTAHLAGSARLDALTGLPLRHGLEEECERLRAQARRHGERMVALMLDLDGFKEINDAEGHAAGDLALRHVATLPRQQCRTDEPVFRFSGEEFLALLQAADRAAAERAAERILQALRESPLVLPDGRTLAVRASAGMAEVGDLDPVTDTLAREAVRKSSRAARGRTEQRTRTEEYGEQRRCEIGTRSRFTHRLGADRALYAAKAAGRDTGRWAVAERAADSRS